MNTKTPETTEPATYRREWITPCDDLLKRILAEDAEESKE
jgi:hypothetical protein